MDSRVWNLDVLMFTTNAHKSIDMIAQVQHLSVDNLQLVHHKRMEM